MEAQIKQQLPLQGTVMSLDGDVAVSQYVCMCVCMQQVVKLVLPQPDVPTLCKPVNTTKQRASMRTNETGSGVTCFAFFFLMCEVRSPPSRGDGESLVSNKTPGRSSEEGRQ